MDIKTLENWLWEVACSIRGSTEASKFKEYILPLVFLKRLSDVFEDELEEIASLLGGKEEAEELIRRMAEEFTRGERERVDYVRFYIPPCARWENLQKQTTGLGEYLTSCMREVARYNPSLRGVIDTIDYNATKEGQRIISDDRLRSMIEILGRHRLGLRDVEPDILGRAYEYLLRKFAEGSGQSAGEFYTPGEVARMMALMMDPKEGEEIYDPCCGSGGLLIKCFLYFKEKYGNDTHINPPKFYGQESEPITYTIAKMNVFIHDMEAQIAFGDTIRNPAFREEGKLKRFDLILANPPWNDKNFSEEVYRQDPYGRFSFGIPPSSSADWGWVQHMYASLKDGGRMAVVLDTGAVSRGSGSGSRNREKDIRKEFVERDLIEAIVLLPENLFYNTTAPGIVLVINKNKPEERKSKVLLIDISDMYEKGRPKNYLPESTIRKVVELYREWKEEEGISKIVSVEEIRLNDYNLSPSRYVSKNHREEVLPLEEAIVELEEAEEERREVDIKLQEILRALRLGGL